MQVVNEMRGQEMGITHALLLHGAIGGQATGKRFATLHDVVLSKDGKPVIGAGVIASTASLERVMGELSGRTALEFMDDRVLALSANAIVWWRKPDPARVWFNTRGDCKLKGRTGVVPQPGLIFAATKDGWYVWAVEGNARPGRSSAVFQAPYMNVWEGGKICTGQAKLPKGIGPEVCEGYEAAFWSSRFTHANIHERSKLTAWEGGVSSLWGSILDGDHEVFPQAALVPMNVTVEQLLKKLSRSKE